MRWLIVGPYPPERGSGADAAAAFVAERLADGDTVHAVSPRPTAAHVHHDLAGIGGVRTLWRVARQQRTDGLWLRIESGMVLRAGTDRRRALLERAALALLLRRFEASVLDVADVGLLPGGRAGRLVLGAASRFVVHREQDGAILVANGAPVARIEHPAATGGSAPVALVAGGPTAEPVPADYPPPSTLLALPADRGAIEAAVRHRAEELRAARAAAEAAVSHSAGPTVG